MTLRSSAVTLAALLVFNLSSLNAANVPARLEITRTSSPIQIDGVLDEEAWQQATAIAVNHVWFPIDDAPAPVATTALLTYDAENLYVAFRAADPEPAKICLTKHPAPSWYTTHGAGMQGGRSKSSPRQARSLDSHPARRPPWNATIRAAPFWRGSPLQQGRGSSVRISTVA